MRFTTASLAALSLVLSATQTSAQSGTGVTTRYWVCLCLQKLPILLTFSRLGLLQNIMRLEWEGTGNPTCQDLR